MIIPHTTKETSQYLYNKALAVAHRMGITNCPWCGYEYYRSYDDEYSTRNYDIWFEAPWLKEIILRSPMNKIDSVIAVSKCPKCGELSWVHKELEKLVELFDPADYNYENRNMNIVKNLDAQKLRDEMTRRFIENINEFQNSICLKCKHFKGIKNSYYGFWKIEVYCDRSGEIKSTRVNWFQTPEDCNDYEKKEKND